MELFSKQTMGKGKLRPSFDSVMMEVCDAIAKRSTCIKNRVGCVIVKDGRIISIGYNGMLPKHPHCLKPEDCPRWNIESGTRYEVGDCQHAEANAIIYCAVAGTSTVGATLYCNNSICRMCAKLIVSARISIVIYRESCYDGIALLKKSGVTCIEFKEV